MWAAVRDMKARVQKAEELGDIGKVVRAGEQLGNIGNGGKVDVKPRDEVIRNMMQMIFCLQLRDKIIRDLRDVILEALRAELNAILGAQPREEVGLCGRVVSGRQSAAQG